MNGESGGHDWEPPKLTAENLIELAQRADKQARECRGFDAQPDFTGALLFREISFESRKRAREKLR